MWAIGAKPSPLNSNTVNVRTYAIHSSRVASVVLHFNQDETTWIMEEFDLEYCSSNMLCVHVCKNISIKNLLASFCLTVIIVSRNFQILLSLDYNICSLSYESALLDALSPFETFNRSAFISVFDHAKISLINMCVRSQVKGD